MPDFEAIQKLFKDQSNLDLALTHRSWLNEHTKAKESNERLEFLGDAILEFIVSKNLYNKYPNKEEGFLTTLRANIVNTENLSKVAESIDLGKHLRLSKGEEDGGGRNNHSLLANTMESIIGALFIDSGVASAEKFINKYILTNIDSIASKPLKDFKSRLQEQVQSTGSPTPRYEVVNESGPDHDKIFEIAVLIDNKKVATGKDKSKGKAQQHAAEKALKIILQ